MEKQLIQLGLLQQSSMGGRGLPCKGGRLPLILSYAVTVHKVQGLSLKRDVIDAGSSTFEDGMVYVALSRVQYLTGLYLIGLDRNKIMVSEDVKEKARLATLEN